MNYLDLIIETPNGFAQALMELIELGLEEYAKFDEDNMPVGLNKVSRFYPTVPTFYDPAILYVRGYDSDLHNMLVDSTDPDNPVARSFININILVQCVAGGSLVEDGTKPTYEYVYSEPVQTVVEYDSNGDPILDKTPVTTETVIVTTGGIDEIVGYTDVVDGSGGEPIFETTPTVTTEKIIEHGGEWIWPEIIEPELISKTYVGDEPAFRIIDIYEKLQADTEALKAYKKYIFWPELLEDGSPNPKLIKTIEVDDGEGNLIITNNPQYQPFRSMGCWA